jgi:hypothetical protein
MSTTFPFIPRLDRRVLLAGTYHDGSTRWTLPSFDPSLDTIVLSDAFGEDAGKVFIPTASLGSEVRLTGDWTAGLVLIGRRFQAYLTPTRPFARDRQGSAMVRGHTTIMSLRVSHERTNAYTIRTTPHAPPLRASRTKSFLGTAVYSETAGLTDRAMPNHLTARHTGRADKCVIRIENETPFPMTIVSLDWELDHSSQEGGQ